MHIVSVGVPVVTDPVGGWNFWPLLSIPLALLVAHRWLGLPRKSWIMLVVFLLGLSSADAISAWGILPVAAGTAGVAAIAVIVLGPRRRDPPRV